MAEGDASVLLQNPDLVATNGYLAFLSAIWFYMSPQAPKPSMHEIATKLYAPNALDDVAGLGAIFGSATMVINGGLECTTESGEEHESSVARATYYSAFLNYFGLPAEEGLGCATMQPFSTDSSSNFPQSFDKNWDYGHDLECKVVPWSTQFNLFRGGDYKRCVCTNWASEESMEDCLNGQKPTKETAKPVEVVQI